MLAKYRGPRQFRFRRSGAVSGHADRYRSRSSDVPGSAFDQMLWVAHGADWNPCCQYIWVAKSALSLICQIRKVFPTPREDRPARCYTKPLKQRCAETALLLLQ